MVVGLLPAKDRTNSAERAGDPPAPGIQRFGKLGPGCLRTHLGRLSFDAQYFRNCLLLVAKSAQLVTLRLKAKDLGPKSIAFRESGVACCRRCVTL
jgi:hypothetical protein